MIFVLRQPQLEQHLGRETLRWLRAGSFLTAMLCAALPLSAQAQDMSFELDASGEAVPTDEPEPQEAGSEADFIASLAEDDPAEKQSSEAKAADESVKEKEVPEEIYAVQQIYALRLRRFELTPSMAFSLNDPFVRHPGIGLAANYWWTNVLAIGANFLWYQGLEQESDLTFFTRRSTRLAIPITEYQLGAFVNATYVPVYGKFSMFNRYIFEYDAYLIGGLGVMRTRPIPVIDPEARQFDYANRLAFNLGIGVRVFVTRWLAIMTELRNYMFLDKLEAQQVALGSDRFESSTWYQDGFTFVNNVSIHIGAAIFLPFGVEYRKPK